MAPYPIAPPPEEEALREVVEEWKRQQKPGQADGLSPARGPVEEEPPRREKVTAHAPRELFSESLLEMSTTRPGRRTFDFIASLFVHSLLVAALLLIPLYFTEAIDLKQFTQTFLVAPPPPPPPPPPAAPAIVKVASAPRRVFTAGGKLLAPTAIPAKVAMIKEEELPPDVGGVGVVGGVPGGVPGGQVGGVIGGIISGAQRTYIPTPAAPAPKAPIRVGGRIKPPRAISTPEPIYPPLAKQAKIQGNVVIDAVIDVDGNVVEMQVISGHPLLIPSAMEALRHWKYEPTYLNEQPVPVRLIVTIKFQMG
jgi:protein TonB